MSTFDLFYLGMVITGMLAFAATLAWVSIYTRGAKSKQPRQGQSPATTAAKRPDEPRLAA